MTNEEHIERIKDILEEATRDENAVCYVTSEDAETLSAAINALRLQDAISRQEAIKTIESWLKCADYNETERHIMRATQSMLYDLPSVTPKQREKSCESCKHYGVLSLDCSRCDDECNQYEPKQRTGHWIDEGRYADGSDARVYRCSVCGGRIIEYDPTPYCECGAKMAERSDKE